MKLSYTTIKELFENTCGFDDTTIEFRRKFLIEFLNNDKWLTGYVNDLQFDVDSNIPKLINLDSYEIAIKEINSIYRLYA